ncbi:competence protein ComC [uncultured Prochlorococcus sp.]|uniref:competence protein ComC n=1 Tax=uncultured Prochlorococcus sp. TaxID=159733 RepID=UPI002590772C|nr:competence protein ComC [uncultured Prochlorococcus sp.]
MSINKILSSLDNSWKRDDILSQIKNGLSSDEIVNEFLKKNEVHVKELNNLLKTKDKYLLYQVEQLSNCEAKLLSKINNLNYPNKIEDNHKLNEEKIKLSKIVPTNKISSLMINWSNKFVVIALLVISAIALSKQAWI